MPIVYKRNHDNVDFNQVVYILTRAFRGRKFENVVLIKKSFLNSIKVVYAYDALVKTLFLIYLNN